MASHPVRGLQRDESGGLEGLPLYMIILVTITAVALIAILLLIPKPIIPKSMSINPNTLCFDETTDVTITVFSTANDPINDATVRLDGPNVTDADKTEGGGRVTFTVTPHVADPNVETDVILVSASFGNVRIPNEIPVTRC